VNLAVYPGSFDPITYGHLDIIERGSTVFDRIVVAVARNPSKESLFTVEERLELIQQSAADFKNVETDSFDTLSVDYVRERGAHVILRGIRTVSDFEYEFQMALANRRLSPDIETVFIMARQEHSFIHASMIKEIVRLGGKAEAFVPPVVEEALRKKLLS